MFFNRHKPIAAVSRPAFTLVEMLVATALTVLIMLLFAQIYGTALGTMSAQRGIGNNDQKARVNIELIRSDLQNMTYRQPTSAYGDVRGIVPMGPGDEPLIDPERQQGYFYYSENEVGVPWDDVLQFTTRIRIDDQGRVIGTEDAIPYHGRSQNLQYNDAALGSVVSLPNQPDSDDGFPGNNRSRSRAAEISYFLRGGNLYRRVILVRDPLQKADPIDAQPSTRLNRRFFGASNRNYTAGVFWNDFDFSATRFFDDPSDTDSNGLTSYLWFNSTDSLSNTKGTTNVPLALPWNRFGHLNDQRNAIDNVSGNSVPDMINDNVNHGMPREYLNASGTTPPGNYFLGRLTHGETSSSTATYPGAETGIHYGMFSRVNAAGQTFSPAFNTISEMSDGVRLGEDIIGTGIEAFDVKVWDPLAGQFVDLGFGNTLSNPNIPSFHFDHQGNQVKWYGPRATSPGSDGAPGTSGSNDDNYGGVDNATETGWPGSDDVINRVFDTWHPSITSVFVGAGGALPGNFLQSNAGGGLTPPYYPMKAPPNPFDGSARGTQWAPNWEYAAGTVHYPLAGWDQNRNGIGDPAEGYDSNNNGYVFSNEGTDANGNGQLDPIEGTEDTDSDGTLDAGEDTNGNGVLDSSGVPDQTPRSYAIGYRVIQSGLSGSKRPDFPLVPGTIVTEPDPPFGDLDGSGTVGDSTRERGAIWQCFDNRVGLRSIQIILRYSDIQTGLPRQVTIEHSFVE